MDFHAFIPFFVHFLSFSLSRALSVIFMYTTDKFMWNIFYGFLFSEEAVLEWIKWVCFDSVFIGVDVFMWMIHPPCHCVLLGETRSAHELLHVFWGAASSGSAVKQRCPADNKYTHLHMLLSQSLWATRGTEQSAKTAIHNYCNCSLCSMWVTSGPPSMKKSAK